MSYLLSALVGVFLIVIVWLFNNHAWGGLRMIRTQTIIFEKDRAAEQAAIVVKQEEEQRAADLATERGLKRRQKSGVRLSRGPAVNTSKPSQFPKRVTRG